MQNLGDTHRPADYYNFPPPGIARHPDLALAAWRCCTIFDTLAVLTVLLTITNSCTLAPLSILTCFGSMASPYNIRHSDACSSSFPHPGMTRHPDQRLAAWKSHTVFVTLTMLSIAIGLTIFCNLARLDHR